MGIKVAITDPDNKDKAPWWWRRRIGLTPFYFGLLSAVAAWASFLLSPGQAYLVLAGLGVAAAWAANSKWGGKKDRPMRNFVWAVIAAFVLFVSAVRGQVLSTGWVFVALVLGVLGLGLFWWKDAWNQKRVKIERDVERWPILAEKIGLKKIHRGPVRQTETGRKWMFWWDEGDYTLGAFKSKARELESALGIPENRIRFEHVFDAPGMKNPNSIVVTENTDSPILKEPVKFGAPTMRKFTDEMFIGPREDNSKHLVTWYHKSFGGMHTLAAGSTGSGKSGLYHLVMAESAYCPDLVRWGIDAKGGMALRPWASLFDWMVTDVEGGAAYWMLTGLHRVLLKRSEYAAEHGWDCWKPSAEHPVIMVVIDEAAEVFNLEAFDMNELSGSIARMGRAAGVLLLIATQHPTNEALSSTQLTKNLRRRFCFSVEDDAAQRVIIPKSTGRFDATDIPIGPQFVGTYYSSEGGQICDLSSRVRFVTPVDVYKLVLEIGAEGSPVAVPDIDELSAEAATEATIDPDTGESHYANRRIWTVRDAIPPEDWVGENDDDITDERVEPVAPAGAAPVHPAPAEPVHAPGPLLMRKTPDAPRGASGHVPPDPFAEPMHPAPAEDADDDPPWTEEDPRMNLDQLLAPRTEAERVAIEKAVAAYAVQYAEGNVSPAEAQRMLDNMLDESGPEGLAIGDMRKVLGRSSSWYSDQLRDRLRAKPVPTVEKVGQRYRRPRPGLRPVDATGHAG